MPDRSFMARFYHQNGNKAIENLVPPKAEATRVRATDSVLDHSAKAIEIEDGED
jgi:hypothetical protein